ncbi:MAG TPA: response regulator [Xanthomonadales bacterium]|nr:response regulator [Xanthomonadales bacterium]
MHRILLVDDEPGILSALRRVFATARPEDVGGAPTIVEAFEDPEAALARVAEVPFDLVISDYRMPKLSGVEFLERMIELQPGAARLILSAYTDLDGLVGAINRARIFRFLSKPWHDLELKLAVRQALEWRALARENARLADLVRVQRGELSRAQMELKRLEEQFPGLRAQGEAARAPRF